MAASRSRVTYIPCRANLEGCLRVVRTKAHNTKYCAMCAITINIRKSLIGQMERSQPVLRLKHLPTGYRELVKL